MTIDVNENVGIGCIPESTWSSYYTMLQIGTWTSIGDHSSGYSYLNSNTYDNAGTTKYLNTGEASGIRLDLSGDINFWTAPSGTADATTTLTTRLTVKNAGNIEIPNVNPRMRFTDNAGTASVYGEGSFTVGSNTGADTYLYFANTLMAPVNAHGAGYNDNVIDLGNGSARFDDIYATNTTIQTSDEREKNTIADSDLGLDFVNALSPKSYIFNGKTRTHYGLIAQDVETVLSDIGKTTQEFAGFIKSPVELIDGTDTGEVRYGLRTNEFVSPMIKAIQELSAKNDALEARILTLENA
jgi:hypothetical protein